MNTKKYKFLSVGFLSTLFFFSFFQTSQAGFFDRVNWFGWFKKSAPQKSTEIIPIVIKEGGYSKSSSSLSSVGEMNENNSPDSFSKSSVSSKIKGSLSSSDKSLQVYSKTLDSKSFSSSNNKGSAKSVANLSSVNTKDTLRDAVVKNTFSLLVRGRAQPYVADPLNRKSGINPYNLDPEHEIPNSNMVMNVSYGVINIENAIDGLYNVYLKSNHNEDYWLDISYMDDTGKFVNKAYLVFGHANIISFTFRISSSSKDKFIINHLPLPPVKLKAEVLDSGGLKTKLVWEGSNESSVKSYNIYSKYNDEPYLKQIGNTMNTYYNTEHLWAKDLSIKTRIYAISALKFDGTESFLSNVVENNDRDHDGLKDEKEILLGTNINKIDTDGDGFDDAGEYIRGTNPLVVDTDDDGYGDYKEMEAMSDPLDKNSLPKP